MQDAVLKIGAHSYVRTFLPRAYITAAMVLLAFLLATNIYRAAHQSITIDEAFTYNKHIAAWKFWKFQEYSLFT